MLSGPTVTSTSTMLVYQYPTSIQDPHVLSQLRPHKMACVPALTLAERVFGTTELLQHILHFCDELTIFRASRIHRRFENVITGSPKLQQKLYFKADWAFFGQDLTFNPSFRGGWSWSRGPEIMIRVLHGDNLCIHSFTAVPAGGCVDMFSINRRRPRWKLTWGGPSREVQGWCR